MTAAALSCPSLVKTKNVKSYSHLSKNVHTHNGQQKQHRVLYWFLCRGNAQRTHAARSENKKRSHFIPLSHSHTLTQTQQNDEPIHFCCFSNLTTITIDESHLITNWTNERTHTEAGVQRSYQYESKAHSSLVPCDCCDVIVVKWSDSHSSPFEWSVLNAWWHTTLCVHCVHNCVCLCVCISMRYLFDPWVPKLNVIYSQSFSKWHTLYFVLRVCPLFSLILLWVQSHFDKRNFRARWRHTERSLERMETAETAQRTKMKTADGKTVTNPFVVWFEINLINFSPV